MHDVVCGGSGNGSGDSGGGSRSLEVWGAPLLMPGMAVLVTAPASGGGLMMPTTRQRRSVVAWGGSDDGNGRVAADQAGWQATTGQLLPQQQPLP